VENLAEQLMQANKCNNLSVEIKLDFIIFAFNIIARDFPQVESRVKNMIEIAKQREAA